MKVHAMKLYRRRALGTHQILLYIITRSRSDDAKSRRSGSRFSTRILETLSSFYIAYVRI
jgi:hypothetical protein